MFKRSVLGILGVGALLVIAPTPSTAASNPGGKMGVKPPNGAPTGAGSRDAQLRYASVPPAAFVPMMSMKTGHWSEHSTGNSATFTQSVAAVNLPDGARIREFSCFGDWGKRANEGESVRLVRNPLTAAQPKNLARLNYAPGKGIRRLDAKFDATTDHVIDNFSNAYQIIANFDTPVSVRGCRVGYLP